MAEDAISKAKKVKDGIKKKKAPAKKDDSKKLKVNPPRESPYRLEAESPAKEPGKRLSLPAKPRIESNARPPIKYPGAGPDADAIISGRLLDPSEGPVGRMPWTKPDKEMHLGQFFAPEDLDFTRPQMGRRPESLGLPPVPQGDALPQGNPESFWGAIPASRPSVPARQPMSLPNERISQPPAPAPQRPPAAMPAKEPNWGFLDKFREGLSPAAGGAASWDPAYNPENDVPSWQKDEEASAYEERRATNAGREDWWAEQTPEQIKANLVEAAKAQGRPGIGKLNPDEFKKNLNKRKSK